MTYREHLLDEAKAIVMKSRSQQYAPPDRHFSNIAAIWSVLFETDITAEQVAQAMIALKLCRLKHTPEHEDSWIDIAGYAACGFEVVKLKEEF